MARLDKKTLKVLHLPTELSNEDKIDLLKFFGAEEVKCVTSKYGKNNIVFAKFRTDHEAEAVVKKLHQTEFYDQVISVEFARGSDLDRILIPGNRRQDDNKEEQTSRRKQLDNYLHKLNSWTNDLDISQPPPVHFKYLYPPPTLLVLSNIAKALASFPKFYTQVLHLMNKMNLPCPFSENFNIESDVIPDMLPDVLTQTYVKKSSDESEIESEEDEVKKDDNLGLKRKSKVSKPLKKPKLIKPVILQPKLKQGLKTEDVFETGQIEAPKKIEVKLAVDLKHLEEEKEEIVGGGFEKVEPVHQLENDPEPKIDDPVDEKFITSSELAASRISNKDHHMIPAFKNYHAGVPSCRLYIKNLAKTVTQADLGYIFRRYKLSVDEEQGSMFDIQLLLEGRMKGQAFISLQNVEQAKQALKETNGYILKGKPLVVQYARSSKSK